MADRHVRRTNGSQVVLVLSDLYHRESKNKGRTCTICGARWTILRNEANGHLHVWRNGVARDEAILDWTGNNAAVECCVEPV